MRRIGIRSSIVRTFDGAEVIIPNGNLISQEVTNWTLSSQVRRTKLQVGVAYGTNPEEVIAILEEVAKEHPNVLGHPIPHALFLGFGESSLDFELLVFTYFDDWRRTSSDLAVATNKAFTQADIEIPFPQRDLHVRSVDSGAAAVLAGDHRR